MDARTKTRENRLRQAAARQRMTLTRARRRDPRAWDYARYWLAPAPGQGGGVVGAAGRPARVGDPPGLTLDEVEAYLTGAGAVAVARPQARPDPAALAAAGLDDAALTVMAGCPAAARLGSLDGPPLAGLVLLARTLAGPGLSIRAAAAAVLGDPAARTTARGWIAHLEERGLAEPVPGGGFRLTGDGKDTLAALDQAAAGAKELAVRAEADRVRAEADRVRAEAEAERLARAQAAAQAEAERLAGLARAERAAAERDRAAGQARVRQVAEDAAWEAAQAAELAREQQAEQRRQAWARTQAREARQRARRAWRRRAWQAVRAERRRAGRRGRVARLALAAVVAVLMAAVVYLPGPHRTAGQPWAAAVATGAVVYAVLAALALGGRTVAAAGRLGWRRIRPPRPEPEPARRWAPGPNAAWQPAPGRDPVAAGQRSRPPGG